MPSSAAWLAVLEIRNVNAKASNFWRWAIAYKSTMPSQYITIYIIFPSTEFRGECTPTEYISLRSVILKCKLV